MKKISWVGRIIFIITSTAPSQRSHNKSPCPNLVALFNHAFPLRAFQNLIFPNSSGTQGGTISPPISIPDYKI